MRGSRKYFGGRGGKAYLSLAGVVVLRHIFDNLLCLEIFYFPGEGGEDPPPLRSAHEQRGNDCED